MSLMLTPPPAGSEGGVGCVSSVPNTDRWALLLAFTCAGAGEREGRASGREPETEDHAGPRWVQIQFAQSDVRLIILWLCFPEIPGLLSTMWQTLGQANSHHSIPASTGRSDNYAPYLSQQPSTNQDVELRPQVKSQQFQEDLSGDIFESWGLLGSEDEEMPGGADLGLGSHMGEEAPLCSQTNMEELRRSCSESQCTAGNINGHVRFTLKQIYSFCSPSY